MSKLLSVMKEFNRNYLQEIAEEQPDLIDLLILSCHLPQQKKEMLLKQLTIYIKESYQQI
ncbi:hypothetical protein FT639_25460 [Bacillus mycoides]|nr:hypothetical protein [Bacillus mycoides]